MLFAVIVKSISVYIKSVCISHLKFSLLVLRWVTNYQRVQKTVASACSDHRARNQRKSLLLHCT